MKIGVWTLIAATCAALLWLGCEDECSDCGTTPPVSEVGSVDVNFGLEDDTLILRDGVVFPFIVMVKGLDGMPRAGVQVDITLLDPNFGVIEFTNVVLRDTTNSDGFILAAFQSYGRAGTQTVTATAHGRTDSQTIVIPETSGLPENLILQANPTTLVADEEGIAVSTISATIVDAENRGIPGRSISFSASGGELTEAPLTDLYGRTQCYWIGDDIVGEFLIEAQLGWQTSVVQVVVTENPEPFVLNLTSSSSHFEADSAEERNILVTAVLSDDHLQGIANGSILLTQNGGMVPDSCVTNGSGVCQFVWSFRNEFGIFQLAAEYEPAGLRDTLTIEVEYAP